MHRDRGRIEEDYDYERLLKRHKEERMRDDYDPRSQAKVDHTGQAYTSICLNGLNQHVPLPVLKDEIYKQFHKFGDLNVRIVTSNPMNRIAFVNFSDSTAAKDAKHARKNLVLFDTPIHIEAVYNSRYKGGHSPNGYTSKSYGSGSSRSYDDPYYSGRYSEKDLLKDHKFPFHLDHVQPEDDPYANRTLFVGNIDIEITETDVRGIFERYGVIEEIDIKRPMYGQGNAYAFIKYYNVDMAHRAKVDMSGRFIGNYQCKIGYGKPTATNCLWVGGLGSWVKPEVLEQEFDRFGVINRIEWPHSKPYAYVLFDSVDAAVAANTEMRGVSLGGPDNRIRVDYADESHMPSQVKKSPRSKSESDKKSTRLYKEGGKGHDDYVSRDRTSKYDRDYSDSKYAEISENDRYRKDDYDRISNTSDRRRHSNKVYDERSSKSNANGNRTRSRDRDNERDLQSSKRRRTLSPSVRSREEKDHRYQSEQKDLKRTTSDSKFSVEMASSIDELSKALMVVWNGVLVLKNSAFAARMHLVSGDVHLVDTLMRDVSSTELPMLKITQRLRLDPPKLDEVGRRVQTSGANNHAVLLALPGSPESIDESNLSLGSNIQQRPLRNLISYLKQKEAAGVISLPPSPSKEKDNIGVLHAFPPCSFGNDFLLKSSPELQIDLSKDDHLVIMVVRGAV